MRVRAADAVAVAAILGGAVARGLWVAAGIWWLLSAVTPFFAWRLARLLLGAIAGAVAAVLTALSPLYVTNAGYFLSETPALAFLLAALWLGYRAARLDGRGTLWQGLLA